MNETESNFLLQEINKILGDDEYIELVNFFKKHPSAPESIRINSLRYNVDDYINIAQQYGVEFTPILGNIPDAYYVSMPDESRDWWNQERLWGKFYSQGNASMIPPLYLFEEPHGEDYFNSLNVIDVCAAPGSKTTQIGSIMKNRGLLVANDYKSHRLYSLHRNLQTFGVANAVVTQLDGKWIGKRWHGFFDKILLDVPCSGTGSNRKNIFSSKSRNESGIIRFHHKQKGLLKSAISALNENPESRIIYSTCSILPIENELVIQPFIDEGLIELDSLDSSKLKGWTIDEGFTNWNNDDLSSEFSKAMRIKPHKNDSDAFFIAKIKKVGAF